MAVAAVAVRCFCLRNSLSYHENKFELSNSPLRSHFREEKLKVIGKIMQSMYSNCYDATIAELIEKSTKITSAEHITVIEKAILSLRENRNMLSIKDELKNHAPVVLNKIRDSDRQPRTIMQIITQEFFDTVKTPDGQTFESMGLDDDVYTLKAKSGTYLFSVNYISNDSITVRREQTNSKRAPRGDMFIFDRFPRFISIERDVATIERIFENMLKKLARGWKYLQSDRTPSNSTSAGPSTNSEPDSDREDPYEVSADYLNNVTQ